MKLIRISQDTFRVIDDAVLFEGTLSETENYMIESRGVESHEFAKALECMLRAGHDSASFGIDRTFIISFDSSAANNYVLELKAIDHVRRELRSVPPLSPEFNDAGDRLAYLYMALNVRGLLEILETGKHNDHSMAC